MKFRALYRAAFVGCMISVAAMAKADTPVMQLVVWDNEGNRVAYNLIDNPSVKFLEDELSISTGEKTDIRIPMSQVSHFIYQTGTVTDVECIIEDKSGFVDGNLIFTLKEGENTIEIVDIQGTVLLSKTLRGNGERIYPLTGLQPGTYIVKFNGLTYKIMKR